MKEIPLTKGFVALVDDEDYELLSKVKWSFNGRYAMTTRARLLKVLPLILLRQSRVAMHQVVLSYFDGVLDIDHRNRAKLDNQKENLRLATRSQNKQNCEGILGRSSAYKGVHYHEASGEWRAKIMASDSISRHLGSHLSEIEAAMAYDRAAYTLHGEFAVFNFPDNDQRLGGYYGPPVSRKHQYVGVRPRGKNFETYVNDLNGKFMSLGMFQDSYDAAMFRDHMINKLKLNSRMNFQL